MERRRRNNIIIGTLCAVLVLMGVGYAILSTTLNIGGTANITGDFDIHFTNIQRSSSTISDSSILSTIDAGTGITANTNSQAGTFTAVLQKPTDYVIYEVSVANTGSIDGYLTFSFEDTNSNFDYYKDFYSVEFIRDDVNPAISTDILQPNATFTDNEVLVKTSGTRTYKIKVTFKESATSFPDPTHEINNQAVGNFECELSLTYSQQAPSNNNSPAQVSSDGWIVDNNGLVTHSPSNAVQNGTLTIPAVDQNGNNIVSIDQNSFEPEYNVIYYVTNKAGYAVIADQTNYDKLSAFMQKFGISIITGESQIPQNETCEMSLKLNLDTSISVEDFEYSNMTFATLNVTTLDLSSATFLTTIGVGTFASGTIQNIIFNNAITTIRDGAFFQNHITSLTIPSSLVLIGEGAFNNNGMTTLDLSHATNLSTIGGSAFLSNNLQSLDFSNATSLTTIDGSAFANNHLIGTLTITSSIETIGDSAFSPDNNTQYKITALDFSDATSLISIGSNAFRYNGLTMLDLSGATSLEMIDSHAFHGNKLQTIKLPPNITNLMAAFDYQYDDSTGQYTLQALFIPFTKSAFENIVNEAAWYDAARNDLQLIYSDLTCDYNNTNCVAN